MRDKCFLILLAIVNLLSVCVHRTGVRIFIKQRDMFKETFSDL